MLQHTKRQVKLFEMFISVLGVSSLMKLRWPKKKSLYDTFPKLILNFQRRSAANKKKNCRHFKIYRRALSLFLISPPPSWIDSTQDSENCRSRIIERKIPFVRTVSLWFNFAPVCSAATKIRIERIKLLMTRL